MTRHRRQFLLTAATSAVALSASSYARIVGANDRLRVGVVGLRSRGRDHVATWMRQAGVRVTALCDVDPAILARELRPFHGRSDPVFSTHDIRILLEKTDIDVVSIAAPNHWHALMTIWACQAGKDVYVEKPLSHHLSEGQAIIRAAKKHERIVQTGLQARASKGLREAQRFVTEGGIGRIRLAHGLCFKRRNSIGKLEGQAKLPTGLDYDLWCGPAKKKPLARKNLHYDWHWDFDTGNGDLGNQGVHQMDLARWFLGESTLPPRCFSIGGRVGYEDDGATPNSQFVVYDFAAAPLVFEVRGLPKASNAEKMDQHRGVEIGLILDGDAGSLVISSYEAAVLYDPSGKEVKRFTGGGDHFLNFAEAVRRRDPSHLYVPPVEGHLSSALCHLGNISHRLGKDVVDSTIRERIPKAALERFNDFVAHLKSHGIELSHPAMRAGEVLEIDPSTETIQRPSGAAELATRSDRSPFVIPTL